MDNCKCYILPLVRFLTFFGICRYHILLCRWSGINEAVLRKNGKLYSGFWSYICFIPRGGTTKEIAFVFIRCILNNNCSLCANISGVSYFNYHQQVHLHKISY